MAASSGLLYFSGKSPHDRWKNVLRSFASRLVNSALGVFGLRLTRSSPGLGYIPARPTIAAARRRGLSVSEYVAEVWGQKGAVESILARMEAAGVFTPPPRHVCEIGPGTGQFLEKVMARSSPEAYEIYEPAPDWHSWLKEHYPVTVRPADGHSLRSTPSASIDLLHAHGVFNYLPFLVAMEYLEEMARVTRAGGYAVFDVLSEECFSEGELEAWLRSPHRYPALLGAGFVEEFMGRRGFRPLQRFFARFGEGRSQYLILRKQT